MRADNEKPSEVKFRSIFTPLWRSSEPTKLTSKVVQHENASTTVQFMPKGTQAKDKDETPLKKKILNVVGERHDHSNQRRHAEKEYCKKYTDSDNYWREGEFRSQPLTEEELNNPSYSEQRKFADPFKLIFLNALKSLEQSCQKITLISIKGFLSKSWIKKQLKAGEHTIAVILERLKKLESGEYDVELTPNEKQHFLSLKPQLENIKINWQDAYNELILAQKTSKQNVKINYKESVDALVNTVKAKELMSDSDLKKHVNKYGKSVPMQCITQLIIVSRKKAYGKSEKFMYKI